MVIESRWHELIGRAKHFHGDYEVFKKQALENEVFYMALNDLKENLIAGLTKIGDLSRKQILEQAFSEVFNFVTSQYSGFSVFYRNKTIYGHVFEACFFTTLCMFIHGTIRIKGVSLRRFLYDTSSNKYNFKGSDDIKRSKYYFDYDRPEKDSLGFKTIKEEETTLRQMRYRLLSTRATYIKKPEWSAISVDSKIEWAFMYVLEELGNSNKELFDTYKRIGNLYNDIIKELSCYRIDPLNKANYSRLESAYKKFSNKLRKIKYENFVELQKEILSNICKDQSHYGMNMYRFERSLRLFNITSEVKGLLDTKDDKEECYRIKKSIILKDIQFPKLHQDFSALGELEDTALCAGKFLLLMDFVVGSSRLIIDELVELNIFGEDWENLFLDAINDMTEKVFYDPAQIEYTITPNSQEKFEKVVAAPVCNILYRMAGLSLPL